MTFADGDDVEYIGEPYCEKVTDEVWLRLSPGDRGVVVVVEPDGEPVVTWPDAGTLVMNQGQVRRVESGTPQ
ncbi:MAG TPA: hypothetical protein VK988_10230 [Acidimicrobiales bacterium]|nr:hypothetical protein [Acidimicrobiales bacterium]